ncbi:hypothetical protein Tco_1200323 [Tanacetum coccineum]
MKDVLSTDPTLRTNLTFVPLSRLLDLRLPKPETPTLKDCQSKLNVLGWLEDDPLYDVALAIFYEPSDRYREGWMQLKPERCAS